MSCHDDDLDGGHVTCRYKSREIVARTGPGLQRYADYGPLDPIDAITRLPRVLCHHSRTRGVRNLCFVGDSIPEDKVVANPLKWKYCLLEELKSRMYDLVVVLLVQGMIQSCTNVTRTSLGHGATGTPHIYRQSLPKT